MKSIDKYKCVFLDSSLFIYFIEENPRYISAVEGIFSGISFGNIRGISSYLTLLEVLVKPIQAGHHEIAMQYKELMLSSDSLKLYPIDEKVAEKAAELRAKYYGNGFKIETPDAIQIATGVLNGAEAFVTNDCRLKRVREIEVILLDELVKQHRV